MNDYSSVATHFFDDYEHSVGVEGNFGYVFHPDDSLPHQHTDFAEFTLIVYGQWDNIYNQRHYRMEKNTVFFMGGGTSHALKKLSKNANHFTFFFRREYFDEFCKHYFPGHPAIATTRYRQTTVDPQIADFLLHEAEKMVGSRTAANHGDQLETFLHNLVYFTFLDDSIPVESTTKNKHGYHLKIHLDRYEFLQIGLEEVYKQFPVSKVTLIKQFKEETGRTITEYRNEKRMEYAAQLLTKWDRTIAEIANKVGISSLSYFSRQFKARYGMLPKEYRDYYAW